jgi:peptidoglycan-associated lipoprotein
MLKKLFTLTTILLLASCHAKEKPAEIAPDSKLTEQQQAPVQEPYQTVDSEAQAEELNKATAAQIQEIEVQDRVFFAYDSFEISDEARKILDTQAAWLKSDSKINILLEGHCDERGTREYNIALGEKRANAAKNYLVSNGVDAGRIKTISYGKERPAFFGSSEEVMAKNRRAVVVVN